MLTKMKIAVAAALVLGSALPASAAPRWRASQPATESYSSKYGPRCTASGGPECYTGCGGANATGAPCKEEHDGW